MFLKVGRKCIAYLYNSVNVVCDRNHVDQRYWSDVTGSRNKCCDGMKSTLGNLALLRREKKKKKKRRKKEEQVTENRARSCNCGG